MKLYIVFLSTALSFLLAGNAHSQERDLANIGSFYSAYGFGAPADVLSPGTMGMGLTGVSNYSSFTTNIVNPAHWGLLNMTQGSLSIGLTNFYASDNTYSAKNSLLAIESFQIALPVYQNKLGVSVSFSPVTRSEYQQFSGGEFDPFQDLSADPVEYETNTTGQGGVNRFEIGAGYHLFDFLSVGYGFSANLLSLQQERLSAFPSDNPSYRSGRFDNSIEGYGFGHRVGVLANFSRLFSETDQLSLGASLNLPVSIDAEKSIHSYQIINNQQVRVDFNENEADRNGSVKIPMEFNAGLTYNLNRFSNFTAEFQVQNWGDSGYSFNQTEQGYYKDRMKAGVGAQFHPYRSDQPSGLLSNFKYSLGTTYDTGHLSIQDENIETLFLNAGIGLFSPGRNSRSSIDLSFQYGIRGTESNNLVKENIWGFKLSLNLAEWMFVRPKFD